MPKPSLSCYFERSPEVIRLAVMTCIRFSLSLRRVIDDVEGPLSPAAVWTQQELHCAQVASLLVDLRDLGASHGMRPVGARLEAQRHHSAPDDAGIPERRQMRAAVDPAGPQELEAQHLWVADPALER